MNESSFSFWETAFHFGVSMESVLEKINAAVWGIPVLSLILIVGVYMTVTSGFAQIRLLPTAVRQFILSLKGNSRSTKGISGYRALCTALAATVGTGNIAGVAGAIAIGGPGVIFWMWICAILGMITKFAEVTLAVHYRQKDKDDCYIGGPMYIIKNGLPKKMHFLSFVYCYFGIVAALGVGNAAQINAVIDGVKSIAGSMQHALGNREELLLGVFLAVLVFLSFRKGAAGIGRIAEKLVPFASVIYIFLAITVLCFKFREIPAAFSKIIQGAFSPEAVTGGVLGSFFLTLRVGTSRGVFTNEAGMGTASIAHAASEVEQPIDQGLMGIMEVFLDTIVICTLTALVILCSGVPIPYGTDPGLSLTLDAFSLILGDWSRVLLTVLTCIFAFATILGWGLYGARCSEFLFGERAWKQFVFAQTVAVILGAVLNTSVVWVFSEIVNGLMAIPNLIALAMLSGVFISILKDYQNKRKAYRLR